MEVKRGHFIFVLRMYFGFHFLVDKTLAGEKDILNQMKAIQAEQVSQDFEIKLLKDQLKQLLKESRFEHLHQNCTCSEDEQLLERVAALERMHETQNENILQLYETFSKLNESCMQGEEREELRVTREDLARFSYTMDVVLTSLSNLPDMYSSWTTWGSCSANPGTGIQYRQRNCRVAREVCRKPLVDKRECVVEYPEWTEWGYCGGIPGNQTRTRECSESTTDGVACPGPFIEFQTCNKANCPLYYDIIENGKYCIKYYGAHSETNEEAKEKCKGDGGHLVYIDSELKQNAIGRYLQTQTDVSYPWIDGTKQDDEWLNWEKEVMTYFSWNSGQDSRPFSYGNIYIHSSNFYWYHSVVEGVRTQYICEI